MTNPVYVPLTNIRQTQPGRTTKMFLFPPLRSKYTAPVNPKHGKGLQDELADAARQQRYFNLGVDAVKEVDTITIVTNPAADDTITINGTVITFKTSGATGNQVNLDSTAALTAAALNTFINANTSTLLATSTVSGAVITITHNTPGTDLTLATSVPAKITFAVVTAFVVGVAPQMVETFAGANLIENTQNVDIVPLVVNSKKDFVYIVSITPASATLSTLTTRHRNIIVNAHAGTAPTSGHGFVFSYNGASRAQISTAMQAAFGSNASSAFVISGSDSEIITWKYNAVNFATSTTNTPGNVQQLISEVQSSAPDLDLTFGTNDEPIVGDVGAGWNLGALTDAQVNAAPATTEVPNDETIVNLGTALTGITGTGQATLQQPNSSDNRRFAAGNAGQPFDANNNYVYPGGSGLEVWSMIIVHDSKKTKGQVDFEFLPEVIFTGGLQLQLGKAQTGMPLQWSIIGDGSAAPLGWQGVHRQLNQV